MEKIIPFIRIKDRLEEVLDFYLSIFPEMKIRRILPYGVAVAEKEGRMKSCTFEIGGQEFMLSDGEMEEAFTSAISFAVNCDTEEEAARLWDELTEEGEPMVETESYPVYEEYGWVKDRFGISWQIDILSSTQRVVPCLAFAGEGRRAGLRGDAFIFCHIRGFADLASPEIWGERGRRWGDAQAGAFTSG